MKPVKKNKRELIDLKTLDKITPARLRWQINLLFNKDIPKVPMTADELIIWNLANKSESNMQQHFHKEFNCRAAEEKFKNKDVEFEFVQNDNGDTAGSQLTQVQRICLYKRKKAEGSKTGFCDVSLIGSGGRIVFCEIKKIGAPSEIHLTTEQFEWFLKLNKMGFKAFITNNPVFFKKVVLKEFFNC